MTEQRRAYAGECVYVGVDVPKETYTVTCVCHKQIVKTATVQAEPASLAASLHRWFPGGGSLHNPHHAAHGMTCLLQYGQTAHELAATVAAARAYTPRRDSVPLAAAHTSDGGRYDGSHLDLS
jgi:hypothetical protein